LLDIQKVTKLGLEDSMHRVFIKEVINGMAVPVLDEVQQHHLRDVLRIRIGEEVMVLDGAGIEWVCSVKDVSKKGLILDPVSKRGRDTSKTKLAIACAIPKKGGMDEIVDGLVQLGVDVIIPLDTSRVIVKLDESKRMARLERWRRISTAATEQSKRNTVPLVQEVTGMSGLVARSQEYQLKLLPTLFAETKPIQEVVRNARFSSVLVAIGPEGDFSPQEVQIALEAGFVPVSLGDSVLRVGIAALATAAYLRFATASCPR
jgi:16S rRNA (uracil1498-N3)-methyltransferase